MTALTLLVIRCRDLELSRSFYQALGLVFAPEQHGSGPHHYSSRLGSTVLELYPSTKIVGGLRLGLRVADVAEAVRSIRALGGQVARDLTPEHRAALLRDPDGNDVELTST
jgi:catechol 2,3-dioxygenase-like lactoylglutathione lyase family enzyme